MKKKKVSLKKQLRSRDSTISNLQRFIEGQNEEIAELKLTIRRIGYDENVETFDVPGVQTIEVKSEQWGQYIAVTDNAMDDDNYIEFCKRELVTGMVNALMNNNAIRFIIHRAEFPYFENTVAAKISVVPWAKTLKWKGKAINERKTSREESGETN